MDTPEFLDIAQIILLVSISIAVLGISYQLMRFIASLTRSVDNVQESIVNFNKLSANAVSDYEYVRNKVFGIIDMFTGLVDGLKALAKLGQMFKNRSGSKDSSTQKSESESSESKANKVEIE